MCRACWPKYNNLFLFFLCVSYRHTQNIYIIIYNYMALENLSIKPRITIFSKTQNKISAILPQISPHLKRSKGGYTPTSGLTYAPRAAHRLSTGRRLTTSGLTYTATGSASAHHGQDWPPPASHTHHGERIGSPRAGDWPPPASHTPQRAARIINK